MAGNRDENRRATRESDPLVEAARYRLRRDAEARGEQVEEANAGQPSMEQRAQIVETAIQQAMRRGDFDN
ncbi:hypothetical protein SB782_36495, partial [Brevibacillus sp. SIMBA_076]